MMPGVYSVGAFSAKCGSNDVIFVYGNLMFCEYLTVRIAMIDIGLYFANEEKDGLVAEKREVFHSMNTSLERLVVEQLLAGSQNGGLSVMPKNTKVLNVSLTDNTCYVNLDSGFISGDTDVAEYIPIYAIVDSLTELQTVNKVQITVNGSADVTYRNVISLAQPLEREEKYIVK